MIKTCYFGYKISKLVNVLHYIYRQPSLTRREMNLLEQCYAEIEDLLKLVDDKV